jgi:hypothetical protein
VQVTAIGYLEVHDFAGDRDRLRVPTPTESVCVVSCHPTRQRVGIFGGEVAGPGERPAVFAVTGDYGYLGTVSVEHPDVRNRTVVSSSS